MLDRSFIGHQFPDRFVDVEAGQVRFFAKATSETNPIYFDVAQARAAGHRDLPAPPTFLFTLDLQSSLETGALALLGIDIGTILHGEQHFEHYGQIYAGDRIKLSTRITDMYEKRGGALEFFVQETSAANQFGEAVGLSRAVTVVRNS